MWSAAFFLTPGFFGCSTASMAGAPPAIGNCISRWSGDWSITRAIRFRVRWLIEFDRVVFQSRE